MRWGDAGREACGSLPKPARCRQVGKQIAPYEEEGGEDTGREHVWGRGMWLHEFIFLHDLRIRGSENQRIKGFSDQRIRGSDDQRIRGSEDQRIRESEDQRISELRNYRPV